MKPNDKVLKLNSAFSVVKSDLPNASDVIDSIFVEGYASTTDVDRAGDVVPKDVWEKGLENYLKNPIILSQHDHDDPIGRMVEHRIDSKGLWIRARISAAAEVFNLIKDGVLTAFSIGFMIKDAEYNSAANVFVVKELELTEISVVSIPCNQNTVFSVAKAFSNEEEYAEFKKQFVPSSGSAKGLEPNEAAKSAPQKEFNMNPEELKQMLADTAKSAADAATKAILSAQADEKAKTELAIKEAAEFDARVKAAVEAQVKTLDTGAERLLADVAKRFEDQATSTKSTLEGLEASLKEKAAEIDAMRKSKMQFVQGDDGKAPYADVEKAILLSKISGKSITDTNFGKELVTKYAGTQPSAHLPNSTWDTQVSLNMEAEVRRKLVIANTLNSIAMNQPVMKIPVNPEAGYGTWVTTAQYGTTSSSGATGSHQLTDITLSAYKLATREYLAFEEDEDSLIAILPIVRDALIRRNAKSLDKAFIMGAGAGADPVAGLATYSAVSAGTTFVSVATGFGTTATTPLRQARKNLGAWGLDPSALVYVVSTELYFALMDDPLFQTMDKVGTSATILTGQVGQVGGTPVLVSGEFLTAASGANNALTNLAGLCYAPANFVVGNQRGLRLDTQDLVESQQKVLVSSLRTGMTRLTSNLGSAVHAIRYTT
jgi:HK97 family phage prohead protease